MKLKISVMLVCLGVAAMKPVGAIAVVDPLSSLNNKVGIHVLDSGEIEVAAMLVNNDGKASWGYVTVPIQASDRDRQKWQAFMDRAVELKIIPIVRVATVAAGSNWEMPDNYDLIDFANFLNDLVWPVKNRYVIIFNEVNREDEYGGLVDPIHYGQILVNASRLFKSRNSDFFILPAGLDNAASNSKTAIYWKDYLKRMNSANNQVFDVIDGWVSHAYPNPGFSGLVSDRSERSIVSYQHDVRFLKSLGVSSASDWPVFITETGWDRERLGDNRVAENMALAFRQVWSDSRVVAVTPFLLRAGDGPFVKFSFFDKNGQPNKVYESWRSLADTQGMPELAVSANHFIGEAVTIKEAEAEINSEDLMAISDESWQTIWELVGRWFKIAPWN